ncbi:1,25-dihydroxyvitamin D(3) 24-hydroxylase, mitochondrial-like [Ptychodera flava]|uniref:1,25-dihydroxyvitamin D(3) 24-hydroxylase, mitochondrial-like n=1 Tax=Ptychodera flava TaxID=63121 RepID=UPI00396A9B2A
MNSILYRDIRSVLRLKTPSTKAGCLRTREAWIRRPGREHESCARYLSARGPDVVDEPTRERKDVQTVRPFNDIPAPPTSIMASLSNLYKAWKVGFAKSAIVFMMEYRRTYGLICRSGKAKGRYATVMLFDPQDFAKVIREEGKYPKRTDIVAMTADRDHRGLPCGIFSSQGPLWRHNRSALSGYILRPTEVIKYTERIAEVCGDLVKTIQQKVDRNEPMNEQEIFSNWSFEAGASTIFGKRFNLLTDNANPEGAAFMKSLKSLTSVAAMLSVQAMLDWNRKYNTPIWKKHVRLWDTIFEITRKCIDEKQELLTKKGDSKCPADYITNLLRQHRLTDQELHSNLTEFFLAATDTTAAALTWALYLLGRNSTIQEKLHQEVTRYAPRGQIITENTMLRNPWTFLKAVVKETLRLYPIGFGNLRQLDHDTVLQGYHIPAGTLIFGVTYVMSRDQQNFEDALAFRPERWVRRDKLNPFDGFKSIPFGFGPRMCLGRRLAELELYIALIEIIRHFRLECTKEVEATVTRVLLPAEPLQLVFTNR